MNVCPSSASTACASTCVDFGEYGMCVSAYPFVTLMSGPSVTLVYLPKPCSVSHSTAELTFSPMRSPPVTFT